MPQPSPVRLWLLRALAASLALGLLAAVLTVSTLRQGEAALLESDAAFDRGELTASLEAAQLAASRYVPGAPHLALAEARLRAIALGAETEGRDELARRAWAALRAAELEVFHPFTLIGSSLSDADAQIARLLLRAHDPKKQHVVSESELRAQLAAHRPNLAMGAFAGSGFLLLLLGACGFAWRYSALRDPAASNTAREVAATAPALTLIETVFWLSVVAGGALLWAWAVAAG
jgi:hypothetical protein